MNRFKLTACSLLLTTVFSGCAFFRPFRAHSEDPWEQVRRQIHLSGRTQLTGGVSKVEITPPVGTPLAGYAKRQGKPSEGIRDPLYVRALVLSDGEDTVVFVSTDLLVFPYPVAEELVKKISRELQLPRQAILLTTTHTHSGSGSIAQGWLHELVFGPYQPEILEGISGRLIWAVRQALEHQEPVRWGMMRRSSFLETLTENRADPEGKTDPSLSVFMIETLEGQPKAMVVSIAAHPTLMEWKDFRFSADYPGELTRILETTYPGAICLFMNGVAGDLRPRDAIGADPEKRIKRFGRVLAEGATGLISRMEFEKKADLTAWGNWHPLPPPQIRLGPIPLHPEIGRMMRPSSTYLNLIALDDLLWVPLPAEMTTDLGLELRRKLAAHGVRPMLLGYSGGYLGYAVTPSQFHDNSYEASMTWYGPIFGITLIEKFRHLAKLYEEVRASK